MRNIRSEHVHQSCKVPYSTLTLLLPDKCVPQSDVLAKGAAAFFKISRSLVTHLSSALRRRISVCGCWEASRSIAGTQQRLVH